MAVDDVRMVMMGVTQWLEEGEGNNKEMTGGNHAECFTNTNVQKQIQKAGESISSFRIN